MCLRQILHNYVSHIKRNAGVPDGSGANDCSILEDDVAFSQAAQTYQKHCNSLLHVLD